MKTTSAFPRLSALAAAVLLSACGALPAVPPHGTTVPPAFTQASGLPAAMESGVEGWQALGDPVLDDLVARGLAGNLDLQQAAERVLRSRAIAAGSLAAMGPSGRAGAGAASRQVAAVEAPGADGRARRSDFVDAVATLSWEIDLFGRLRSRAGAASARAEATEADGEALRLAVVAEIAHAWFALDGAREQASIARAVIENRRATLALVQRRAAEGYSAPIDEARARAELAAAAADLPVHEAAATVATHRLAVLLGEMPSGFDAPRGRAVAPHLVELRVPAPARWAGQRPDLRSAEAALRAHALDVEAVRAEFLPAVSVTGALGFVAGSLAGLGAAGSSSWFVAPGISVPLFDYARIEARLEAARAEEREALLHYRQRVLLAVEEVESALARVRQGQSQLAALHERARHARVAEALALRRYEAGASDLLELLDAQRGAQQAELGLAGALTAQRQHVVALHRALGTGVRPAGTPRPGGQPGREASARDIQSASSREPGPPSAFRPAIAPRTFSAG